MDRFAALKLHLPWAYSSFLFHCYSHPTFTGEVNILEIAGEAAFVGAGGTTIGRRFAGNPVSGPAIRRY